MNGYLIDDEPFDDALKSYDGDQQEENFGILGALKQSEKPKISYGI